MGWSGILWWLWPLWGPGSARRALFGGVRFARLGGGVAVMWSGASLIFQGFLREFFDDRTISDLLLSCV